MIIKLGLSVQDSNGCQVSLALPKAPAWLASSNALQDKALIRKLPFEVEKDNKDSLATMAQPLI